VLDILLEAQAEPDSKLDDRQIRDEVMTLMLAGHETTANLLSWTLLNLMRHPDVEALVVGEIRAAGAEGPLLQRVLQESLRMYPPAWAMDREVIADDEIGGYRIPAGSVVFFPPYFVHRHRDFWPDPERFDPERFNEEVAGKRHRHAFVPFGAGPRLCVGRDLAMTSAGVALATILPRVRLELVPGHPVALHPAITLRPKHGLRVIASARA
jgi:cytochrome P450